jgi:2-dehydro-3-deoxygalactonokinase
MTATHYPEWIAIDQRPVGFIAYAMIGDQPGERHQGQRFVPDEADALPWEGWQSLPIFIAGAAPDPGAFCAVPCPALGHSLLGGAGHAGQITLINGLRQQTPPAITNGAECAIAGFLSVNPDWDGVVCVLGDCNTWAHVSADEIVSFQCFETPRLVSSLGLKSTGAGDFWADAALFTAQIDKVMSRPESLAAALAQARAAQTLGLMSDPWVQIQGAAIGAELAAVKAYWLGQNIALIGETTAPYEAALRHLGAPVIVAKDRAMRLAGLIAARRQTL